MISNLQRYLFPIIVLLLVLSSIGCGRRAAEPMAAFSATPTSGDAPLMVQFTDASSDATAWSWDFDNDGTADSTQQNPTYEYSSAGTYTVKLTVTGGGGSDVETKIDYITVNTPDTTPGAPSASFSANPATGEAPLEVQFTDTSSGDVTLWSWDFDNDGVTDSTAQNPQHTYAAAGTYTVKLTVTGPDGSDSESKFIEATAPTDTLTAGFTCSKTSGAAPLEVQFTDTSTGGPNSWSWDFDGNSTIDSTLQNPQYTYDIAGSYYVRLDIAGEEGAVAHMIQQITVSEPIVPYVYDPTWWSEEKLVWYYGQPLGSGQQQYYDAMTQTGVGAVSWLDIRFTPDWETTVEQIVARCHNRGIPAVGTLSQINTYQEQVIEPTELQAAIIEDPWGNQILFPDYGFVIHSMIHPDWVNYLKDCIERTIDLGVDGFLIDELCYGNVYNPDFSSNTITQFKDWLAAEYTTLELSDKGISDIAEYNYVQAVKDHLGEGENPITITDWTYSLWSGIPLSNDYQRFLRAANRDTAVELVNHAKQYALDTYDRAIPVTANLSDMAAAEALYVADLLDFVTLEWHYMDHTYFPVGRVFASVKLAEAFGLPATILTDMATRSDIKAKGAAATDNLYKTMIADAYASGGAFHLEEGGHQLVQDLTELAPYYNFVPDNPELFNGLTLADDGIGVLHLWEAIDPFHMEAYRGICNLLADTGYQFETIFAAEEYTWWDEPTQTPAPPGQVLTLGKLDQYDLIIIPELHDITPNHADILLQYVDGGGTAIIFAEPSDKETLHNHRNNPINTHIDTLLDNLSSGENPYGGSSGKIIRYDTIWGIDYLQNLTASLKTNLKTELASEGLEPWVDFISPTTAVGAFAYEATGKQVMHLVNYNYNAGSDTTPSVTNLELDIDLGFLSGDGTLTATFYTQESSAGEAIPIDDATGGIANITIPELDIWGVLVLENTP